jgi:Peptidase family M28
VLYFGDNKNTEETKHSLNPFFKNQGKNPDNHYERTIASVLGSISEGNIQAWVNHITDFRTRHTKSKFINQVAHWLKNEFEVFGYNDVYYHNYSEAGYDLRNVICHKQGRSNKVTMIGAHYDCRIEDPENAEARSPGADDNASGLSCVLELARILAKIDLDDCVQFVFFSGEEQGQWGSTKYANHIRKNGVNLHRLINLDMVGHPSPNQRQLIIERDMGNAVSFNDKDSENLAKIIEHMAINFTDLQVQSGPIYDSDYMPFEALGYVVSGLYDGGELHPSYHSKNDIVSNLNIGYISSVTKTVLATILHGT